MDNKNTNAYGNIHRLIYPPESLNDLKTAGSLIKWGFPFSVLAKCLQFFEKKCEENFEKVILLDNWEHPKVCVNLQTDVR